MSVTGNRADRIIIDDPHAPETAHGAAREWTTKIEWSHGLVVHEGEHTLADCKAKFDNMSPFTTFVGLDRPRTVEEFNRLYLCHWQPEDDGDQDTRL